MDMPEHHNIDRLKEEESKMKWRLEQSVFSQTNVDTVSRAVFGKLLRDMMEHI